MITTRQPVSLWPQEDDLGLMTDLYQLTMMAGYFRSGMADRRAEFELFVRRLPHGRAYLVLAGLEQALAGVLAMRMSADRIAWLRGLNEFKHLDPSLLDALAAVRFEGDVWAMAEGTVVFPGETLVRVSAPLPQAQWVETYLLAALGYPTLVASKAARMTMAARGRPLYEFGARRGHGPQAGLLAARSAYLAGFAGTSLVEAGRRLEIPVVGTMGHSWIQAFDREEQAFAAYAQIYPGGATLLVDTYDVLEGVRKAAAIEPAIAAVRIDSGELDSLARAARAILDEHGRAGVKILCSGDLDETKIARLVAAGAPIDGFGIGVELVTSRDAPALSMVYKLVELEGQGKYKLSPGKRTYPMAKQVYRRRDPAGRFAGDLVARADEPAAGEPLLERVVQGGRLVHDPPSLIRVRERCRDQLAALPDHLLALDAVRDYPVVYSDRLEADARRLMGE